MKTVKWIVVSGVLYDELGPWRVSGSGKTTAVDYLVTRYFVRLQYLADPLKEFMLTVLGDDWVQLLWGDSESRTTPHARIRRIDGEPLSARYALETIGAAVRKCYPQAMVQALVREASKPHPLAIPDTIVVPDVRLRTEFDCLRQLPGSFTVRMQRFSIKPLRFCSDSLSDFEREMLVVPAAEFDWILDGGRSVEELLAGVDRLAEHLGLERR